MLCPTPSMNLNEIYAAIDAGKTVHWINAGYTVIRKSADNRYYIHCPSTGSSTPLLYKGELAGAEANFFLAKPAETLMTDQHKPLWKVMDNASWDRMKQGPYTPQDIRAAEILALADEVAPEEPEPEQGSLEWIRWSGEQRIRAKLLKAVAEAEG
jgi:hypothetical protein